MKVGDKFPVVIEGIEVTKAEVVEVNHQHNLVELVIPGTSVVMGMSTRLQDTAPPEPTSETQIIGTTDTATVEPVSTPVVPATAPPAPPVEPVGEQTQLVEAPTPEANNDAAAQQVEQVASE